MELRKFISQSLVDIIGGVQDAQESTRTGCVIPVVVNNFKAVDSGISEVQVVDFEVSVRADQRAGSEAKLSVAAAVIGGGVKGESGKSGGHVATLKFRVPIRFPSAGTKTKSALS